MKHNAHILNNAHPTRWWELQNDGRVLCTLCPRACKLNEGQRGLCFVRARENNEIVLTTYGRSSGFCIDPIEKKPLAHFLPGTSVLSFGTAGCNLACSFCQNWEISKSREMDTLSGEASPQAIAKAALDAGCASVAYTYNDPIIFAEYAIDIAAACREVGIKSVAVTAGYVESAPRIEFFKYMDAANVDLKAFTESFYKKHCKADLQNVLETLEYLVHKSNVWLEITTLLIPDENDSPQEIDAMTRWIYEKLGAHIPLHFSAFHPDFRMKDKLKTPHTTLIQARQIALKNGLHYVYTGNVVDEARSSTWCHACGTKLIGRHKYKIITYALTLNGCCPNCSTPLAGVFSQNSGDWGNKRQRIHIAAK